MSIKFIEKTIEHFLKTEQAETLGMYGLWGNGKTFFWNEILKNKRSLINKEFKRYSYVSLFGINNLNDLKKEIFNNMINTSLIGEKPPSFATFIENLTIDLENKDMSFANKWFRKLTSFPRLKAVEPILNIYMKFAVKDTVICFDDIERKGTNLTLNDTMGLILDLKERNNCKIVLIYNFDQFDSESQNTFRELQDKVLDKNILFSISPNECYSKIANENLNKKLGDYIAQYITKLNLSNMRIIKKIENIVQDIEYAIKDDDFDDATLETVIKSLCLFCYCHHIKGDGVPSLDLLQIHKANIATVSEHLKEDAKGEDKKIFLRQYNYQITTKMDLTIVDAVITGLLNYEAFLHEARKIDQENKKHRLKNEAHDLFDQLFSSFDQNEKTTLDSFINRVDNYKECYSAGDVDYIIRILKTTGNDNHAKKILDGYINYLRKQRYSITSENYPYFNLIEDEEFLMELETLNVELNPKMSFKAAIEHIIYNNGYSPEHITALMEADEEQYIELLLSLNSSELIKKHIDSLLKFSYQIEYKGIHDKTRNALLKIAQKSKLNSIMVDRYIK